MCLILERGESGDLPYVGAVRRERRSTGICVQKNGSSRTKRVHHTVRCEAGDRGNRRVENKRMEKTVEGCDPSTVVPFAVVFGVEVEVRAGRRREQRSSEYDIASEIT